jgi:hypothetical protein
VANERVQVVVVTEQQTAAMLLKEEETYTVDKSNEEISARTDESATAV